MPYKHIQIFESPKRSRQPQRFSARADAYDSPDCRLTRFGSTRQRAARTRRFVLPFGRAHSDRLKTFPRATTSHLAICPFPNESAHLPIEPCFLIERDFHFPQLKKYQSFFFRNSGFRLTLIRSPPTSHRYQPPRFEQAISACTAHPSPVRCGD